ncbi:unnamed protein product [Bemisia tabaci]|uniref:DnaJ homolog subfamily C member 16 n=1 Tax=Bemisia tabaci TaxID=7038 RepID=A0A9P0AFQ7_BEMTA|nr:PREDICTED: dnaJ homolog subfamily C member 16 [Bemisia tabaci]CAH0390809.1 unnamed protein product [Bemisia tabaci]
MLWRSLSVFALVFTCVKSLGDPYQILNVPRTSTPQEIKRAYKQLAKEWHPDKNKDPEAEEKFVEIKQAYELLSDPERRQQFDVFGTTEEQPQRDDGRTQRFDADFFAGSGFSFKFQDRDITVFHKLTISSKIYENKMVPKSTHIPYLMLFYSDWCFSCLQIEPIWRKVIEELEPLGVGVATVHAENEQMLARRIGIRSLPSLVLLIDGRTSVFRESLYSVQKVIEFVRMKMPYKLSETITDDNVNQFLGEWAADNRVRALLFHRQATIRLRYLLQAYYHRDRVAFGFVSIQNENTKEVQERFQVATDKDTLLLFNENTDRPMASLSMIEIPVATMRDVIDANKLLLLPRLSSQAMLDTLCPVDWTSATRIKKLCVLLVSGNTPYHDPHRQSLRRFAQESRYPHDKVSFMYVFQERQSQFINALTSGEGSPDEPLLHIAVLWRRDNKHIKYEWILGGDSYSTDYNTTKERLEPVLERLLHSDSASALLHEAVITELTDEHAQNLASRVMSRILSFFDAVTSNLGKEDIFPVATVIVTICLLICVSYFLAHLMNLEESEIKKSTQNSEPKKKPTPPPATTRELKLHELRAETYNGLIRLLKPGCRTIILVVDTESRKKLIMQFHRIVWPYRKNKTLMFGYINLDRASCREWFSQILSMSLLEPRPLSINPHNCIGTVLSLNGLRKYFCIYHAKHPESRGKSEQRLNRMTKELGNGKSGAFLGFESDTDSGNSDIEAGWKVDSQDSNKYNDVIFEETLLDGLPNWLDRHFEGSTHRYYINYWPEFNT